jgi:glutamate/tyrosine decarboxylase-like PLP-dependent enzyme
VTDPTPGELADVIAFVAKEADRYLAAQADAPARHPAAEEAALSFEGRLPEEGAGALAALAEIASRTDGAIGGPRFFHFVKGGVTPASLGADWLASTLDQNSASWVEAPLTTQLEILSIAWLLDLFDLPEEWGGVLTTGATMANFVALACARRWWAEQHGVDVDEEGLAELPPVPVLASGFIHPSDRKALAMLGLGRGSVRTFSLDDAGRLDVDGLEAALRDLGGAPSIVIGSAGEVNAGEFDPLARMADLAERHNAWFHVDGAFGLFAAVSPRTAHYVEGVRRADSVIADGHKWLNVPYESGFAFVKRPELLQPAFSLSAAYLMSGEDPHPVFGYRGPESSRRARSLAVWATLRAYGRSGYRGVVERHLDLAQRLAGLVDEAPDLERLADVPLNIVCFRFRPDGVEESALDDLNRRIGAAVLEDGRVYFGTTTYRGSLAFRPAIVHWRTTEADIDLVVAVTREIGARVVGEV